MRKLWLAVVLGVILGLGASVIPNSAGPVAEPSVLMSTLGAQRTSEVSPSATSPLQWLLIGLLIGLVIAIPVLVMARRRI